jgi:hypothetical protein
MEESDRNTVLFASLVMTFHAAAMQHMGKLKNPATDKIEVNLDQAQYMIDMLEMLELKTKSNLTTDEQKLLSSVSQELKLNYVDVVHKQQSEQKS